MQNLAASSILEARGCCQIDLSHSKDTGRNAAETSSSCCGSLQQLLPLAPPPWPGCCQAGSSLFSPSPALPTDRRPRASGWQPFTAAVVFSVLFLIYSAGTMAVLLVFRMIWNTFCVRSRKASPRVLVPLSPDFLVGICPPQAPAHLDDIQVQIFMDLPNSWHSPVCGLPVSWKTRFSFFIIII